MRAQAIHRIVRRLRSIGLLPTTLRSLDEGAGLGLLVRLLRDSGYEAWGHDPYALPIVAEPYILPTCPDGTFQLVTAIEVIEHTQQPVEFVQSLATRLDRRGVLILTTELYEPGRLAQPETWPYLAQDYGQHITLLSAAGLQAVSARAGLAWWCSLAFSGIQCVHLLGHYRPPPWKIWQLGRRHTRREARLRRDDSV
jgi:hypothetical protein